MPYRSNRELPEAIRNVLPEEAPTGLTFVEHLEQLKQNPQLLNAVQQSVL